MQLDQDGGDTTVTNLISIYDHSPSLYHQEQVMYILGNLSSLNQADAIGLLCQKPVLACVKAGLMSSDQSIRNRACWVMGNLYLEGSRFIRISDELGI